MVLFRERSFRTILSSSERLVRRQHAPECPLVTVATDGETYGHHFKFGDLALAMRWSLKRGPGFPRDKLRRVSGHHAPEFEVEINNGPPCEVLRGVCPRLAR